MVRDSRTHAGRFRTTHRPIAAPLPVLATTAQCCTIGRQNRSHGRAYEEGNPHFLGRHSTVVPNQAIVGVAVQE